MKSIDPNDAFLIKNGIRGELSGMSEFLVITKNGVVRMKKDKDLYKPYFKSNGDTC